MQKLVTLQEALALQVVARGNMLAYSQDALILVLQPNASLYEYSTQKDLTLRKFLKLLQSLLHLLVIPFNII